MAYVEPVTRAAGYVIPASEWAQNTVDNPIALRALIDAITYPCNGRLTLTTAVPVTTTDVTAATTLYWAPYTGNHISLYSGSAWVLFTQAELSIAVPATTNQMYDAFVDYNAGTPALTATAWTNDTTRATALTTQDGVLVLTGSTGKRYVGSFRTTGSSGQTEDSLAKRYVWNYYNRVSRVMRVVEATDSWTYTTDTWRQVQAAAGNQLDAVVGVVDDLVEIYATALATNSTGEIRGMVAIGHSSTTAFATGCQMGSQPISSVALVTVNSRLITFPTLGYQYFSWLERGGMTGTTTWYGDNGNSAIYQSGIMGVIRG